MCGIGTQLISKMFKNVKKKKKFFPLLDNLQQISLKVTKPGL